MDNCGRVDRLLNKTTFLPDRNSAFRIPNSELIKSLDIIHILLYNTFCIE